MELKGRTALITGSAKGLGKRVALELARQGCSIVLNYNTSEREARTLQEELRQLGVRTEAIQADMTIPEEAERLAQEAEAWSGANGIDILINNAGPFIHERRLFSRYSREDIISLVNGNLLSVMLLDQLLLKGMRARRWGRIIHFGFGHAGEARSWPYRAVYAAAKTGLVSFTKTLAAEEAAYGITVNMICPGDIRGMNKERSIEEAVEEECEMQPGRPGTGEDVSRVIAFLCQCRSDYLTGNLIDVNGGFDPIIVNRRNQSI
ncbi:SDR family oxidoreductase [Paenibacillus xylaniclasticus]|uniref:SDR family oxidoreductase n=1 Tax=Paenibacillus xylaniclasticus TaxID=588083 RepID=UPI000FDAC6CF|nr:MULTISPECIES: SDR family oxidoreductase [Paenibacillus]GFN31231.1 3-ketoacyl-ACP reductase [Paenibacillus curdlanolyticus]